MFKVPQVKIQEKRHCRFKNTKHAKFDRSREQVRLIERWVLQKLTNAQTAHLAQKVIKVSDLFYIVFKGNLKTRFIMTLKVLLWDLKGTVPSPFRVTTINHSHTFRTNRFEVAVTRSYIANDLNLQWWS